MEILGILFLCFIIESAATRISKAILCVASAIANGHSKATQKEIENDWKKISEAE